MKKLSVSLVLVSLLVALAACGGQNSITMQQVYDAHLTPSMLTDHGSVSVVHQENGEVFVSQYLTKDFAYEDNQTWSAFVTDHSFYYNQNVVYQRVVYIGPEGPIDLAEYRASLFDSVALSPATLMEKIQSTTEAEGKLTVVSEMDSKTLKELDEGQAEGRYEYVLDAQTHDPIMDRSHYVYEDGTAIDFVAEYAYDMPLPEAVEGFLAVDGQKEDLRTVTFVFEPGTQKEKTLTVQGPKGVGIGLMALTGEMDVYQMYDDADCTQVHVTTGDNTIDATVYVKWLG